MVRTVLSNKQPFVFRETIAVRQKDFTLALAPTINAERTITHTLPYSYARTFILGSNLEVGIIIFIFAQCSCFASIGRDFHTAIDKTA